MGLDLSPRFVKYPISEVLYIILQESTEKVIGYVYKHPDEEHWMWFYGVHTFEGFQNIDDAIQDCVNKFVSSTYDREIKKIGLEYNENYNKR